MIYNAMLQRLDYDQENRKPEDIRREFDNELGVSTWKSPITVFESEDDRPEGAPSWWVSDEEASQGFLQSMGVAL